MYSVGVFFWRGWCFAPLFRILFQTDIDSTAWHFLKFFHLHFPTHSRLQIGDDVSFFTQESTIEGFMACPLSTQQYSTALIQPATNKGGEQADGIKRKTAPDTLPFFFHFSSFSFPFSSLLKCRFPCIFLHKQAKVSRAASGTFSRVYFNSLLEKSSSVSGSWKS